MFAGPQMITSSALYNELLLAGHEASCHRARLRVETGSTGTLLRVHGEIDATTTHFLAVTLQRFLAARTPLIVDLTEVTFLSIGAIGVLLDINNDPRYGGRAAILTAEGPIRRLMQVVDRCGAAPAANRFAEELTLVSLHRQRPHVA